MFRVFVLCCALLAATGCKKVSEKIAEHQIMSLITDYNWYVHSFKINNKDSTHLFESYMFDFEKNHNVYAILHNERYNGTWQPNVSELMIHASFNDLIRPLKLISQNWKILGTTNTSVRARAESEDRILLLTLYRVN